MLAVIGKESIYDLFDHIPDDVKITEDLKLPTELSEWELEEHLNDLAQKNINKKSYLGGGSYNHYIPNIIQYLTSRSEFLTSYTPYQPEISQGTLQSLFEFQTYVSNYLGMDYSNASMYDGATSFAEAVLLSTRVTKRKKIVVSKAINPKYIDVLKTYVTSLGIEIIYLDYNKHGETDLTNMPDLSDVASISIQSPNYFGVIEKQELIKPIIKTEKTLFISLFSEILSYGLFKPPGEFAADIACGEGQSFGINQSFGGPSLGIFAFNKKYLRNVPGRLVGQSIDINEQRSFSLTLATREQHIRRDKATSNICSNQGLCTLSAIIYMSLLGGNGLNELAKVNYQNSSYLKSALIDAGYEIIFSSETFNEFVVKSKKILPGISLESTYPELKDCYLITVTEVFNKTELDMFISDLGGNV